MSSTIYFAVLPDATPLYAIALLGALSGVLALVLYLVDRREVRAALRSLREVGQHARDPAFLGAVLASTITHGAKRPDGEPVTVPDVMQGLVEANAPRFQAWIEEMLPQLIAMAFNKDLAKTLVNKSHLADGVSKLGGGLLGMQALQHGLKRSGAGALGGIGQLIEAAPALIQISQQLKELSPGGPNTPPSAARQGGTGGGVINWGQ